MSKEHTAKNAIRSRCLLPLIVAINAMALASIVLLTDGRLLDKPLTLIALLVLAATVSTRPVSIPGLNVKIVAGDVFMLFALIALAPAAAPLVALASMLGTGLARGARVFSIKMAFNAGALSLSVAAAALTFHTLGGAGASSVSMVVPLLAASAVYVLLNVVLTATAVHLGSGRNWLAVCRQSVFLAVVSTLTSALLGAALLLVWSAIGPLGLLLGLIPVLPLQEYHRSFANRRQGMRMESTLVRELAQLPRHEDDVTPPLEEPSVPSTPPHTDTRRIP